MGSLNVCGVSLSDEVFVQNKYLRWYAALMNRALSRPLAKPYERHHVLPRSLGGSGGLTVNLTFREHFVAHVILAKCTFGIARKKMCHAAWSLTRTKSGLRVLTSSQYETARKLQIEAVKGNKYAAGLIRSAATIEAHRAKLKGRPLSEQHKARIGAANKGKKGSLGQRKSAETRERMRKPKSQEHIEKIRAALFGNKRMLGHKHSEESRAKMRLARWGNAS